ncbi:MAG: hypothetical protein WDO06_01195 [Actinomycetota bacterium]
MFGVAFTSTRAWSAIFLICASFQIYRSAFLDAALFLVGVLFMHRKELSISPRPWHKALAIMGVVTLFIFPHHNFVTMVSSLALLPFVFSSMDFDKSDQTFRATKQEIRSAKVWALVAILACIWELTMYFCADDTGNDRKFPTITDLIDPQLASTLGKTVFLVIWLFFGLQILKVLKEK